MTLRVLRIVVIVVCVTAIAGMVAGSVANNDGLAITSGLVAGVAVVVLMAATFGARDAGTSAVYGQIDSPVDEERAAALEAQIQALVDRGTDETALRALVGEAVRLGRGR
jgi:hypothetical protein